MGKALDNLIEGRTADLVRHLKRNIGEGSDMSETHQRLRNRSDRLNFKKEDFDYGFIDRLKRNVGAYVDTWEEDFEVAGEDETGFWRWGTPGHKFACRAQNTRNGVGYGAMNGVRYFDSEIKRSDYIRKYLVKSQRSLSKKFAEYNR
jgi:hypothetical protein